MASETLVMIPRFYVLQIKMWTSANLTIAAFAFNISRTNVTGARRFWLIVPACRSLRCTFTVGRYAKVSTYEINVPSNTIVVLWGN
jgi:hypothetical protein